MLPLLATACAGTNEALFVTSTSVSVLEGDTKPPGVSIAYKRVEGYIGPNDADGDAPPVIASIESDGKVWNTRVRQLYATGDAAVIAAGETPVSGTVASDYVSEVMFFGTSTNVGLTIGTTGNVPDSFALGYKRKEASVVPLVDRQGGGRMYPSVLASVDTTGAGNGNDTTSAGLSTSQFFATGLAADALAGKLSRVFIDRASRSLADVQRVEAGKVLNCYAGVPLSDRPRVWSDADRLDLFFEDDSERGYFLNGLRSDFDAATDSNGHVTAPQRLFSADATYTQLVFLTDASDEERTERLVQHGGFVCGLANND